MRNKLIELYISTTPNNSAREAVLKVNKTKTNEYISRRDETHETGEKYFGLNT